MKKDNRENVTTIIHDIKTSYAKTFHEKFPIDNKKMEEVLNHAAHKVKKGATVNWYKNDIGEKKLKIFF